MNADTIYIGRISGCCNNDIIALLVNISVLWPGGLKSVCPDQIITLSFTCSAVVVVGVSHN